MMIRHFSYPLLLALLAVGLMAWPAQAQPYLTPTGAGPSLNTTKVISPLNSSSSIQQKAGLLFIGPNNGSANLCLNADDPADPARCIDGWNDVTNAIGGPFLHYDSTTVYTTVADGKDPNKYTAQPGFVRIQAACVAGSCIDGSRQLYSYLTAAPFTLTGAYGLYATDSGTTANYAGYFSGRLHIYPTIGGVNPAGQLCLNGLTPTTECIDEWTDIAGSGGSFLQLQSTNPPSANTGSISVSGTGVFGSVVIDTPPTTMSSNITCGDGLCSVNESQSTCPLDCAPIAPLPSAFVATSTGGNYCSGDTATACTFAPFCISANKGVCQTYTGTVTISTPSTQLPAGSQVNVLVLRSSSATPSFIPLQGSTYAAGSAFADSTIIYAGKINPSQVNAVVGRDRVTSPGTYYYRAYVGNLYPRYGTIYTPLTNATVTYKQLFVSKSPDGGTPTSSSPDAQISCGAGTSAFCTGQYPVGTTVKVVAGVVLSGYTFGGWDGCLEPHSSSNLTCTVTMNNDTVVTATYTTGGGGGGGGGGFDL